MEPGTPVTPFVAYASQPHYARFLAPIVARVPDAVLQCASEQILATAHLCGLTDAQAALGRPRAATGPPVLVAGYRDAHTVPHARRLALVEHGAGQTYCLDPMERILTSDLRWVPIGEAKVGERLVAFEETATAWRTRQWREAEVLATERITRPCYRLTLSDGMVIVASADHRWLTYDRKMWEWSTTEKLQPASTHPRRSSKMCRLFDTWTEDTTHTGGYLAAAFDGEGSFTQTSREGRGNRLMLTFTQRDNAMLLHVEAELQARGFDYADAVTDDGIHHLTLRGGGRESFRFLGSIRPHRLMANLRPMANGAVRGQPVELVALDYVGEREVVATTTSTGTMIVEGLASHNCDANNPMGYAGGEGLERLELVVVPGPHAAEAWKAAYPALRVVEVGPHHLARPSHRPPVRVLSNGLGFNRRPVVAFTFHWRCSQSPESWTAVDDWWGQIQALGARNVLAVAPHRMEIIGHYHPRWLATRHGILPGGWDKIGVETVHDPAEVLRRADLLVADNTSMLYEHAAQGRPVLVLNATRYRRNVDHGLRFWTHVPGHMLDPGDDLECGIRAALDDRADLPKLRRRAVERVYGSIDVKGQPRWDGADLAAEEVLRWAKS